MVVPTHSGDLAEAVVALSLWPNFCSEISRHHMQLVVYYSGSRLDGVWSDEVIAAVEQTGGRCFERTTAAFADLDEKVTGSSARLANAVELVSSMILLRLANTW